MSKSSGPASAAHYAMVLHFPSFTIVVYGVLFRRSTQDHSSCCTARATISAGKNPPMPESSVQK